MTKRACPREEDNQQKSESWSLLNLFKRRRDEPLEIGYQLLGERTAKLSSLCAQHPEIASDAIDIVFVGLESAGKSSLLQRYVQMEQLPVAKRKCTTVPFEIKLHHDESVSLTTATLEGKEFTRTDLQRKNRPVLDATPVRIDVRGPSLPTITFIDTPGVFEARHCDERSDEVAVSKSIAASYIDRPHSVIVLVADISIPLRLNSVWDMLSAKMEAGRALVAFTHADKASEPLLQERLAELQETAAAPACVLLCNQCTSPRDEQHLLSKPLFAAMEHRGIVEFNRALAAIIEAANHAVIPALVRRIRDCHRTSRAATAALGTPITLDNLAAAQDYLRDWMLPRLVAPLRCEPPDLAAWLPATPSTLPDFLRAAAERRTQADALREHYEGAGRARDAGMRAAVASLLNDPSPMKLGRFPDLQQCLLQRVTDLTRRAQIEKRLGALLAKDATCRLDLVHTIYNGFLLDLHHDALAVDFRSIGLPTLCRENSETLAERARLDQQQQRLVLAAKELTALQAPSAP